METITEVTRTIVLDTGVTGEMLRDLRDLMGESLSEFGLTLKRAIDPRSEAGYTRQYVSRLEHGRDRVTDEIASAFNSVKATFYGVPAGVGGSLWVQVMAMPGQVEAGTYIKPSLRSKVCARPGCQVVFLGHGKYHAPECARIWYNERRRIERAKNASLRRSEPSQLVVARADQPVL